MFENLNSSYFEKSSNTTWLFYRGNRLNAKYIEISFNFDDNSKPIVILQQSDGMYAKLEEGSSWYGLDKSNMPNFLSSGSWKLANSSSGICFSFKLN